MVRSVDIDSGEKQGESFHPVKPNMVALSQAFVGEQMSN